MRSNRQGKTGNNVATATFLWRASASLGRVAYSDESQIADHQSSVPVLLLHTNTEALPIDHGQHDLGERGGIKTGGPTVLARDGCATARSQGC